MWLSIAFLLAWMASPQGNSQVEGQYQLGANPAPLLQHSQAQLPGQLAPVPRMQFLQRRPDLRMMDDKDSLLAQDPHLCLAIRSYIFKRDDDKAPVLVKTMTCTPSTVFMQKAGHPPGARLVPAN